MMSRWCDQSIPDERHSAFSSGPLEVAVLFGTLVAETILASVHVRAHKQAGHMDASDLIKHCKTPCKEGVVHIWKIAAVRPAVQFGSWSRNILRAHRRSGPIPLSIWRAGQATSPPWRSMGSSLPTSSATGTSWW